MAKFRLIQGGATSPVEPLDAVSTNRWGLPTLLGECPEKGMFYWFLDRDLEVGVLDINDEFFFSEEMQLALSNGFIEAFRVRDGDETYDYLRRPVDHALVRLMVGSRRKSYTFAALESAVQKSALLVSLALQRLCAAGYVSLNGKRYEMFPTVHAKLQEHRETFFQKQVILSAEDLFAHRHQEVAFAEEDDAESYEAYQAEVLEGFSQLATVPGVSCT